MSSTGGQCPLELVVFDFDMTLASANVGYFDAGASNVVDRCFGGKARVAMLESMLQALKDRGCFLAVVSQNSKATIKKAVQTLRWAECFFESRIIGWEDSEEKKSVIIASLLAQLGVSPDNVLFLDDMPSNVKDVETNVVGSSVILVKGKGITEVDLTSIEQWCNRNRQ
jgi:HAD superfamily phosphatase (TIGR01681 family)